MIFDIVQTMSNMSASYEARCGGQKIGTAYIENNFLHGGSCAWQFMGQAYELVYQFAKQVQSWSKPVAEKTSVPYKITQNDQEVGEICIKLSDGGFFRRYEYYLATFGVAAYQMYSIGLGKEGMKYPIYCGDMQIALLEKCIEVRDHLDVYHAFAVDSQAGLIAFLFGIYLDMREFANRGKVAPISYEKSVSFTINKALKAKYDPTFKKLISN